MIALPLLLLLAACGPDAPLALDIETSTSGLLDQIDSFELALHNGDRSCPMIRASGPNINAVVNQPFKASKDVQIDRIMPATWTVAVWGFAAGNDTIAFGCTFNVVVEDGARTPVTVVVEPYLRR